MEDFTVAPRLVEAEQAERSKQQRRRATSAVSRLVTAEALESGTRLTLRPTTEVEPDVRDQIEEWVAEAPSRGRATWTAQKPRGLQWEEDGSDYTPTGLVRLILTQAAGLDRGVRGTSWWVTDEGDDLVTLADELAPGTTGRPSARRDWSDLHDLLAQLPPGRWTTYGDLAAQIGSAAIAVGQHVTSCDE